MLLKHNYNYCIAVPVVLLHKCMLFLYILTIVDICTRGCIKIRPTYLKVKLKDVYYFQTKTHLRIVLKKALFDILT